MTMISRSILRTALIAGTALTTLAVVPATAAPGHGGDRGGKGGMGEGMCAGASVLSVTGTGQSRVDPDLATVQLGVTTQAGSAADAMRENGERQGAVIQALSDAGIAESDIQTSGLNLNPVMDYGEGRAPSVTGYMVTNTVMVRVSDLDRLGQALDAIVGAGANEINGITFSREDGTDGADDATRAAVQDARRKAELLADAAGLQLGGVIRMSDSMIAEAPGPRMMRSMAADAAAVPVQPGQVDMSAQVQIDFALMGEGAACARMAGPRGPEGGPEGDGKHRRDGDRRPHGKPDRGAGMPAENPAGNPAEMPADLPPGHPPVLLLDNAAPGVVPAPETAPAPAEGSAGGVSTGGMSAESSDGPQTDGDVPQADGDAPQPGAPAN